MSPDEGRYSAESLRRLFRPKSVALVGATDRQPRSNNAWRYLQESDVTTYLVTPSRSELYGQPTYPTLSAVGEPVDAAFVMVNAEATVQIIGEAAELGVGGLVLNAGGFAENGAEGAARQQRLRAIGGPDLALLGPNCNGYIDPVRGVRLSGAPPLPIRGGTVGVVSHTGAVMAALGVTGFERGVGFSQIISTGNEAAIDMADCLDFLVDDDATRSICLIIESIRRPEAFFAAADRAMAAGKPIVALKLGRSARSRAIASSHTGSVAGESYIYEAAFRQHGIILATDLADLMDRVIVFDQVPARRWSRAERIAVLTASGGGSALAADAFDEKGLALPELADTLPAVREAIPTATVANPLDMTGFVIGNPEMADKILRAYVASDGLDTLVLQWFLDDAARELGAAFIDKFTALADSFDKTLMVASLEDTVIGTAAAALPDSEVVVARGLQGSVRSLDSMSSFMRYRQLRDDTPRLPPEPVRALQPPDAEQIVDAEIGPILTFEASMDLLRAHGVPVAPFHLIGADDPSTPPLFDGPYVVKLADVAHRTELGAVSVRVDAGRIAAEVARLREIAIMHALSATVVVQPMISAGGEAFAGVQNQSPLGGMVLCGLGGVLVEQLRKVVALRTPFDATDARHILADLDDTNVFTGLRGQLPWDRDALIEILGSLDRLSRATTGWLDSLDINPLLVTSDGFVAVDCLAVLVHHPDSKEPS